MVMFSPSFDAKFSELVRAWRDRPLLDTISGGYRNPVHNWRHLDALSAGSGLSRMAKDNAFRVEQRDPDPNHPARHFSGVGHVHVEIQCH